MTETVCALGFFDGVHKAHSAILSDCVRYAKEKGFKSIALSFEKSPLEFFGHKTEYLTTLSMKEEFIKALGIDEVVFLSCDEKTLSLSPEEFVESILFEKLNAKALFCGFNYTFGKGAKGDSALLKELCTKKHIELFVSPCMEEKGEAVSSSRIRKLLSVGDVETANTLLTRPFEVRGRVMEGKKLGRRLNFPTANIYPENLPKLPYGVYATKTIIDNQEYISVTNVGVNPTVNDNNLRIETFITNFDGDIYQRHIKVRFYKFLRNETKFNSIDDLKAQIEKDTELSLNFFN